MGIKAKLAERKFRKLAKKHIHQPVFPNMKKAKKIGVIYQPSNKRAYQYIKEYFHKEHVIFRGFCVFEETANPLPDFNTLTTDDLTWLGLPKQDKIDDFLHISFDVLFNIALEQNLVLNYITHFSNARFKIGTSPNDHNFFDLNIKIKENDDSLYLAKQQIFYLAQLNKSTGT